MNDKPVAVVLGASSGVGAAIVRELSWRWFDVLGFHRGNHQQEADRLEQDQATRGRECKMLALDVGSSWEHVIEGVGALQDRKVKVLVHSLSGASVGSVLTLQPAKITTTFNNLAHSFLWWVQELHRRKMFAPHARIIALSNPCPDFYLRNSGVIGAAKAALESYVKTLAVELGRPIRHADTLETGSYRINAVRFSTVLTPALEKVIPGAQRAAFEAINQQIMPAGRMTTGEDVAQVVGALTSNDCAFVNGAVLDVTGGAPYTLMDAMFNGPR